MENDLSNADPGTGTEPMQGTIRQLRPSDLPRFRDHLLRLDPENRRDRFNGLTDDDFVAAYADRSFADGTTVIGYVEGDQVLGAAELHERAGESEPTAEIAFSVEQALQHRGIGSKLFERLIAQARGLGYTKLRVATNPQNAAMKALARRFNATLHFVDGETVGVIDLDPPETVEVTVPFDQQTSADDDGVQPAPAGNDNQARPIVLDANPTPVEAVLGLARAITDFHLIALGARKKHGSPARR